MHQKQKKFQYDKQFFEKYWSIHAKLMHAEKNMTIHFGHFGKGVRTHEEAVLNRNNIAGKRLDLDALAKTNSVILDAGCGVGGTCIQFAKKYPNIKFIGITNTPFEIKLAHKFAQQNLVSSNTAFIVGDYLKIGIINNYFDGIFAIQSFGRANDKKQFLHEAYRILKPNKKILIDDAFMNKKPDKYFIKLLYDIYCTSWEVPYIQDIENFKFYLKEVGFGNIQVTDTTKNVGLSFLIIGLKWLSFYLYGGTNNQSKTEKTLYKKNKDSIPSVILKFMAPIILALTNNLKFMTVTAVKKNN